MVLFYQLGKEISVLREDFKNDVKSFFDGDVTIFEEEEMENFLYDVLEEYDDCPHRIFR